MQESYIAISSPSDLALTPIGGINGEASEGTMFWQVTTDNSAGYSMSIKATTAPALTSGTNSFADYVPAEPTLIIIFLSFLPHRLLDFLRKELTQNVRFKDNGIICNIGYGEA